jgi:uncharacterized protein (DUF305 family)
MKHALVFQQPQPQPKEQEPTMSLQFTRKTFSIALATIVLGTSAGSYAQPTPMPHMGSKMESKMESSAAPSGGQPSMDMRKSMDGMHEKMGAMQMSDNVDHDFAMMMRVHHQGALDMAQVELDKGKDPVMRGMAKKIIASQKKEIAQFDRWLAKHKQ